MNNKLPAIREHQLQTLIQNYLTANGWYVIRLNSGRIRTQSGGLVKLADAGTPDLMAFRHFSFMAQGQTKLVFIEVKTPQNPKPTLMQTLKMQELEEHGARCFVVHSLEELEECLTK